MRSWFSGHLTTLIIIPVLFLFIFVINDSIRSLGTLNQATDTLDFAHLVSNNSALVHELQKERGMSAGFLSSQSSNFSDQLAQQRKALDQKRQQLETYLSQHSFAQPIQESLNRLMRRLGEINTVRQQVTNQTLPLAEMLSYYTENNRIIIELNSTISRAMSQTDISQQFNTLYHLASVKESAGIERAVLSSIFAQGALTADLSKRFLSLLVKQQTHLRLAELAAGPEYQQVLADFKQSSEETVVNQFRSRLENPQQLAETNPEVWFDAATQRINLLKDNQDILIQMITDTADELYSASLRVIVFDVVLLIAILLLTFVIINTLKKRSEQTKAIRSITNLVVNHHDLSKSVDIVTEGNLGDIANDINKTLTSLNHDFKAFQQSANEVVAASQNTTVIVDQTNVNLRNMHDQINQLVETFNQLNASINSDILDISSAEEKSSLVAKGAKEGAKSVSTAVDQINDMASEIGTVGNAIKHLNERVNDILGMVDVIRSVADQTNLLALNAAIEAARAGEQGRGFAVVADEVRSLAKRTQESTEEIARVVDELISSSNNAYSAIEVGTTKANNAVDAVNSIDDVLNEVVANITELDSLTHKISDSAKNQMHQVIVLTTKVMQIDTLATQNAQGGENISDSAIVLFNQSVEMLSKINQYQISEEAAEQSVTKTSKQAVSEPSSASKPAKAAITTPTSTPKPTAASATKPAPKKPAIEDDDNIEFF